MTMTGVKFRTLNLDDIEGDMAMVHQLVSIDLTEPYTIAIYIYFLKNWPELAIFAYANNNSEDVIGVIVGSLKSHQEKKVRGYIAMLAVQKQWRGKGIAKRLISEQVAAFRELGADEIVLEAESSNEAAMHLYQSQGFLRTRRMHHYYSVMQDAYRLVLPITEKSLKPIIFLPALSTKRLKELAESY